MADSTSKSGFGGNSSHGYEAFPCPALRPDLPKVSLTFLAGLISMEGKSSVLPS